MPDTSEKFMLTGEIIDMVLDAVELVPGPNPQEGYRRTFLVHSGVNQLDIIKKIEEVYLNE